MSGMAMKGVSTISDQERKHRAAVTLATMQGANAHRGLIQGIYEPWMFALSMRGVMIPATR